MDLRVVAGKDGHRLGGDGAFCDLANSYLAHLRARSFSDNTVRAYAFDLLNFGRFITERGLAMTEVTPADLFDWLDWQARKAKSAGRVVRLNERSGPVDHRERDLLDCHVVMSGGVAQEHVPGLAARRDRVPGCAALAGQERGEPLAKVPVEAVRGFPAGRHGVTAGMMPAAEVRPVAARRSGSRWTYHAVEEYFWCPM